MFTNVVQGRLVVLARSVRAAVEALEERRLMSAGIDGPLQDPSAPADSVEPLATVLPFSVNINFQPGASPVYSGYLVDGGSAFGPRGTSGFAYGWNSDNFNARDRNSARSPDQRYDTLNHMQVGGNRRWEIEVPNGTYQVRLAAGDADYINSVYQIDVEGLRVISGTPSSTTRWFENTAVVTVADGRLTVSNGTGALNNKINFIELAQLDDAGEEPPPPPPPLSNAAPTVGITSPGSGSSFDAGSTITIVANATDADGAVAKVEFFANGAKIGEDLGGDFDTDWFNAPAGSYSITAVATDDDGATTTSAPIALTVRQPASTAPAKVTWSTAAASPIKRFEAPSVVIDGKVWVFGGWYWDSATSLLRGSRRVDVYDPATNTWSRKRDLPTELTHQGVIADGNSIYMVGGFVGPDPGAATDDIWRYSISANAWTKMTWELPEKLAAGAAVLLGRRLHWIGGSEENRVSDTDSHWSINLDNPSAGWTVEAPLPNARHHFSAAVVNGKAYVFGGQHGHDTEEREQDNTAHVYDPATGQWTTLRTMPRAVSHAEPSTFVLNGRIYIAGGMTTGRVSLRTLTEYDPQTNTYRELTALPNALTAPVVQAVGGKIFVTGGTADVGGAQNRSWLGTLS